MLEDRSARRLGSDPDKMHDLNLLELNSHLDTETSAVILSRARGSIALTWMAGGLSTFTQEPGR